MLAFTSDPSKEKCEKTKVHATSLVNARSDLLQASEIEDYIKEIENINCDIIDLSLKCIEIWVDANLTLQTFNVDKNLMNCVR